MTEMNRVKGAAEYAETHRFIEDVKGYASSVGVLSENHQVVSMDDFLVFLWPDLLLDVLRLESLHPNQQVGRKIDEAFGEFLTVGIEATHRVAGFKLSSDFKNP